MKGTLGLTLAVALLPALALASTPIDAVSDAPQGWTAPPYWSPTAVSPEEQSGRLALAVGRQALVTTPAPLPFVALTPCRVINTRSTIAVPFPFPWGPPALLGSGFERTFPIVGQCGIPADARAVSFNFTVVTPASIGDLRAFPAGGATPAVSTLNWPAGVFALANAAVVPLGPNGIGTDGITVHVDGTGGTDFIADVNGYYSPLGVVNSLNGQAGDLTLVAGANVSITPSANTLTLAATGVVTSVLGTNGISASPSTGAVTVTSNATSASTVSTIVARDSGGSFNATGITLTGDLNLPATNAAHTAGALTVNGSPFLHAFGINNTFLGILAGSNGTMSGSSNTGVGPQALSADTTGLSNSAFGAFVLDSNTTGSFNAAFGSVTLHLNTGGSNNSAFGAGALSNNISGISNSAFGVNALQNTTADNSSAFGAGALQNNTTGIDNSAFGFNALTANQTGLFNAAFGATALQTNVSGATNTAMGQGALAVSTGSVNTALGGFALQHLTSGSGNTAIGGSAGLNLVSGSSNIYIGANPAVAAESNTLRLGSGQTSAFMDGVFGQTSAAGVAVFINSLGKLGTTTSSKRYKEEIVDMDSESDVLLKLRPVSFFYKPEYDPSRTRQYGLIAEEVAEVAPTLAVFDKDGHPETVRYHLVNAMLLNEVQKNRRLIDELRADRAELRRQLDALEQRLSRVLDARPN